MACDTTPPVVLPISPSTSEEDMLDVISRYKKLMTASVTEDSLYELSKKTIFELSKDLNLTEQERAQIVTQQITQMTTSMSNAAMQVALEWAAKDATIGYETAILKENASKAAAEAELTTAKICTEQSNESLVCANIEATIASSIRDNGRVDAYDQNDPCKPIMLKEEGLKYAQTDQVNASTYQILADAYRKSGVVQIGVENGTRKGLGGDNAGHTFAQTMVANRQVTSFEDSKRNHAVNASSQTIGQLIAAEAPLDASIIRNYNVAMNYLLSDSPSTIPGGPADLDGAEITWNIDGVTDYVDAPDADSGNLVENPWNPSDDKSIVTLAGSFTSDSNVRNGDYLVIRIDGGYYYGHKRITTDDITNGYAVIEFPTVEFDGSGSDTMTYNIELFVRDAAGNESQAKDSYVLNVKYQDS